MIGGTVTGVHARECCTVVALQDGKEQGSMRVHSRLQSSGALLAIDIGDSLWWQGRFAFWTAKVAIGLSWRKDRSDLRVMRGCPNNCMFHMEKMPIERGGTTPCRLCVMPADILFEGVCVECIREKHRLSGSAAPLHIPPTCGVCHRIRIELVDGECVDCRH